MSKDDQTFVVYFVELCTNVIANVSYNVQNPEMCTFMQGFLLFLSHVS